MPEHYHGGYHSEVMVNHNGSIVYWFALDWHTLQEHLDFIENRPKTYRLVRVRLFRLDIVQ